jgi:hypothetical protein
MISKVEYRHLENFAVPGGAFSPSARTSSDEALAEPRTFSPEEDTR